MDVCGVEKLLRRIELMRSIGGGRMDYIGYYPLDRLTGRHIGIDPGQWHGFVIIMKDLNNNYPWGLCCWTVATSKAGNNDALKHII